MSLSRLKTCLIVTTRFYSQRRAPRKSTRRNPMDLPNTGIRGRIKMLQETDDLSKITDLNDVIDPEDYGQFESDFMNASRVDLEHAKETKMAKEQLTYKITKRRFFTEKEPSFLTFTEKIEIQRLHEKDTTYWTPERLSESFPASPDIIKKVLRAKWLPRTVEKVQKYDQAVIENWKLFKSKQLAVDPVLQQYLEKFQERTIVPASEEYIKAHLLEPKIEFKTPKNTLFTNFINHHLETSGQNIKKDQKLLPKKDKSSENEQSEREKKKLDLDMFAENKNRTSLKDVLSNTTDTTNFSKENATPRQEFVPRPHSVVSTMMKEKYGRQSFTQFLQENVQKKVEDEQPEASLMRDVYEKEKILSEQKAKEKSVKEELKKQESVIANFEQPEISVDVERKIKRKEVAVKELSESEKGLLHTYVKKWTKLYTEEDDYHECIKIPRSRYQMGMTYRIKDCYYDSDGQFLYRVPGLKA